VISQHGIQCFLLALPGPFSPLATTCRHSHFVRLQRILCAVRRLAPRRGEADGCVFDTHLRMLITRPRSPGKQMTFKQSAASLTTASVPVMIGFIAVLGVDQEIWSIWIQIAATRFAGSLDSF